MNNWSISWETIFQKNCKGQNPLRQFLRMLIEVFEKIFYTFTLGRSSHFTNLKKSTCKLIQKFHTLPSNARIKHEYCDIKHVSRGIIKLVNMNPVDVRLQFDIVVKWV